jgi:hypothetical protein
MISKINVVAPELISGLTSSTADEQLSWNIIPNPNAGEFSVNLNNSVSENVRVVICDLTGRVVHDQSLETNSSSASVRTNDLPPGMYLVSLQTSKLKVTKRMVVNH